MTDPRRASSRGSGRGARRTAGEGLGRARAPMADLESILKAAPIGLLMFFGTYLATKRRQSGRARAAKELPELARQLGLESRAAAPGSLGALSGDYDGYRVYVDPDERP